MIFSFLALLIQSVAYECVIDVGIEPDWIGGSGLGELIQFGQLVRA